ncbi:MAG: hypothetical protein J5758_00290, partial [Abditibacteriota bacterium]|nr:hypothetical protein [Abditibacteriota bacterium]
KDSVALGFDLKDPAMNALKSEAAAPDTYSDNDDRLEIHLLSNTEPDNCYKLIFNADGVVYDAFGKDLAFNGNPEITIQKAEDGWNGVCSIPGSIFKSAKTSFPPQSDDVWLIKVFRKSGRGDIAPQSLNNYSGAGTRWERLYFGEGTTAFTKTRSRIISRMMELEKYKSSFPPEIAGLITSASEEVNSLLTKEGRTNVELASKKLNATNAIVRYYTGARSQLVNMKLPLTLPVCCSFVNSNSRLYLDKENLYPDQYNYSFGMAKGERKSLQFAVSAWQDAAGVTLSVSAPRLDQFIRVGTVEYADISATAYSEIYDSTVIADPIIYAKGANRVSFDSIAAGTTRSMWMTIDLDENAPAGTYPCTVELQMGELKVSYPFTVKVWNFAIDPQPDFVMPLSDFGHALSDYAGYTVADEATGLYRLDAPMGYYRIVGEMAGDMVSKRLLNGCINIGTGEPWLVMTSNEFGKWSADASVLASTLKCIYVKGIKQVALSPYPYDLADVNKYQIYARTLGKMVQDNGWQGRLAAICKPGSAVNSAAYIDFLRELKANGIAVWLTAASADEAAVYAEYADVIACDTYPAKTDALAGRTTAISACDSVLESNLSDVRKTLWNMYLTGTDKYMYSAHNSWTVLSNPFAAVETDQGLNADFRVYPGLELLASAQRRDYTFETIDTLRMEATVDAITDLLYIRKANEVIMAL